MTKLSIPTVEFFLPSVSLAVMNGTPNKIPFLVHAKLYNFVDLREYNLKLYIYLAMHETSSDSIDFLLSRVCLELKICFEKSIFIYFYSL